jgi:hypothetical protein
MTHSPIYVYRLPLSFPDEDGNFTLNGPPAAASTSSKRDRDLLGTIAANKRFSDMDLRDEDRLYAKVQLQRKKK